MDKYESGEKEEVKRQGQGNRGKDQVGKRLQFDEEGEEEDEKPVEKRQGGGDDRIEEEQE